MQAFLEPLKELADYQEIVSSRRKKRVSSRSQDV